MVADSFETILDEIARVLELESLKPDANNSCLVKLKNGVEIQIEPEKGADYLLIGSDLGEVLEGHYRESLFQAALQYNAFPYPKHGAFSFSRQTNHVVLFKRLPLYGISGEFVAMEVAAVSEKASKWKEAISKGDIPAVVPMGPAVSGDGMFGLKP